ncbi:unnamed protein product [Linum tenue]|uniref:TIR domain-containing protein n=1 Tax=Linum tenue TaxID=586396 RepID=A0AAV0K7S6_9ROSI|nr:unnamed protein product [Linum tenue]
MSFITQVKWLLQPIILLYKFLFGRRISDTSNNNNNTSHQLPDVATTSIVSYDSGEYSDPLPLPTGEYEVFLSFRGPDTRHQLTDILYRFLVHLKIRTFRDDDELRQGEGIWTNLVRAIGQSKVYIPIMSETYAHSKWCLKELAEIVECQKRDKGHIILPIFYMVDPRDVRHQTGPYQSAFQEHVKKFDAKTIQVWRNALSEVGTLKGWHVKSKDEQGGIADCVSDIVWSHLSKNDTLIDTDELVGIDDCINAVVDKLSLDSEGVIMVGLHGLGGIGKTTIASAVYNRISAHFDRCCFLENIRETQEQKDGTIGLQKKLITTVMRKDSVGSINNVDKGKKLIRDRVSQFKVLVVLDDVDERFTFEDILGKPKSFISGSRFIITSRNMKLLSTFNENQCKLYEVGELSPQLSLQLFSKHAFKGNSPPPDYENISVEIVSSTGGLPLTLKVVGSLLFREDKCIWEDKLAQMKETPEKEVVDRLKISYDALGYAAKQIFLDIACLFIGMEKEMPSYMWSDCQFHPVSTINILIQRSLIKLMDDNKFRMHDQLRDMGRAIVREENIEEPWMRSRIWEDNEGWELLSNMKGSKQVKALRAYFPLRFRNSVKPEHFAILPELRYFDAVDMDIDHGDFTNMFPNLRWLALHSQYCYNDDIFLSFHMRNLVILDLRGSENIVSAQGWNQIKLAKKLKVLDLSGCFSMYILPEFPTSGSLEILSISGCGKWEYDSCPEMDIRNLWNLKVLNLSDAKLEAINGGTIGMLELLQELDLTDLKCKNADEAFVDIGTLPSLKVLKTIGAGYILWEPEEEEEEEEDHETSHEEEELNEEETKDVMMEVRVEETTKDVLALGKLPTSLKLLHTSSRVVNLPELLELEELLVQDCDFGLEIPPADENTNIWWKVSKWKSLRMKRTKVVITTTTSNPCASSLPLVLLPSSLTKIHISYCPELEWLPILENLENLIELVVENCDRLQEIRGLEGLKSLRSLLITSHNTLTRIHGLKKLLLHNNVQTLQITYCPLLAAVFRDDDHDQSTMVVDSLRELCIYKCRSLLHEGGRLPRFSSFPKLMSLELGEITSIEDNNPLQKEELELQLEGIACLEELVKLKLDDFRSIERLPSLAKLRKLADLELWDIPRLCEIQGITDLKWLKTLSLRGCTNLTSHHLSTLRTSLPNASIRWPTKEMP